MQQIQIVSGKVGGAMKTVIYGPEGIGKSTLAAQFPRPVFIDTEGSTRFMDVSRLPNPSSWAMLMDTVRYVKANPGLCSTLVIDTADWAEQLCITGICASKRLTGIEDMGYGKGYVYLAEEFGRLLNLLDELVNGGIHVVLTAHAQMRKFEQPDEMGAYDRWELKLRKKTAALIKEWSDVLLFANYKTMAVAVDDKGKKFKAQGGKRVLYTTHHPCWDAKNRLGLPEELPLDYAPLAPYYNIDAGIPASEPKRPAPVGNPASPTSSPSSPPQTDAPTAVGSTGANEPPPSRPDPATPAPDKAQPRSDSGALRALRDLMRQNNVEDYEIQAAVATKGYFPEQTPLENYPDDFIQGVLIGAWPQVLKWIVDNHPLPF